MALRLLDLLGNPLVHVSLHPQLLVFLLSRENYSLYNKVPYLVRIFWMKLKILLTNSLLLGNQLLILI